MTKICVIKRREEHGICGEVIRVQEPLHKEREVTGDLERYCCIVLPLDNAQGSMLR